MILASNVFSWLYALRQNIQKHVCSKMIEMYEMLNISWIYTLNTQARNYSDTETNCINIHFYSSKSSKTVKGPDATPRGKNMPNSIHSPRHHRQKDLHYLKLRDINTFTTSPTVRYNITINKYIFAYLQWDHYIRNELMKV